MSQEKAYLLIVKSLTEDELYKVSKLYLKEVEGLNDVIVTNGPWDSGIDLLDIKSQEYQIQATVEEKNFEKKLESDLVKAKRNVDDHGLSNKIKYFYSYPISNSSIFKYKRHAKEHYNLILDIIEANHISQVSIEYTTISKELYRLSNFENVKIDNDFFNDVKVKAFYDLMSFGKTTDFKYSIVKSFVLNYLFNHDSVAKSDLLSETNIHFSSNIQVPYFDSVLHRLSSERRILVNKGFPLLTESERDRINLVLQNFQIEEGLLLRDVKHALETFGLVDGKNEVISQLAGLYESTFSVNLSEFTYRDSNINDVKTATYKLKSLIDRLNDGKNEIDIDKLIKTLIKIADSSEILPRIAAGQVYSKVSDPDRLQEYIKQNINNKTIFLDANVLLYIILAHYDGETEYNNYFFRVANQFLKFAQANDLKLKTIRRYAIETTKIFTEALSLIPFSKTSLFDSLGGSSNPIYRFYSHLKDYDELLTDGLSFEGFLNDFSFSPRTGTDDNFKSSMEFLLDSLHVEIEDFPPYELGRTVEIINQELRENNRVKSHVAINSDAIMFCRLADRSSILNPIDPIFCTWDLSLIRARKRYFEYFPSCTQWFMFTPTRLMDHFSMMNFQIKPGTLSNELLSILDEQDMQQMTHTLLDSIKVIINPDNVVGLKYSKMLAEMRKKDILEVNVPQDNFSDASTETLPTDMIFRHLFDNYIIKQEDKSVKFKKLFTKEQYFDEMTKILLSEKKYVVDFGKISEDFVEKIDTIMEKVNSDEVKTLSDNQKTS
jgi:hypothetical protein